MNWLHFIVSNIYLFKPTRLSLHQEPAINLAIFHLLVQVKSTAKIHDRVTTYTNSKVYIFSSCHNQLIAGNYYIYTHTNTWHIILSNAYNSSNTQNSVPRKESKFKQNPNFQNYNERKSGHKNKEFLLFLKTLTLTVKS